MATTTASKLLAAIHAAVLPSSRLTPRIVSNPPSPSTTPDTTDTTASERIHAMNTAPASVQTSFPRHREGARVRPRQRQPRADAQRTGQERLPGQKGLRTRGHRKGETKARCPQSKGRRNKDGIAREPFLFQDGPPNHPGFFAP